MTKIHRPFGIPLNLAYRRANTNLVRTFTYDQKLARKIARLINEDKPFRYGDRVVIRFLPGSNLAVKIKGKPGSRPSP